MPNSTTSNLNAPTIDFTGSSIQHNDDQRGDALFYLFDTSNRALVPYANLLTVDDEVARMLNVGAAADTQLSITPLYLGPSRSRFRLTNRGQPGDAKEYSSLVVSFAQHQTLANLKDKLSWSAIYTPTEMGNKQDVPELFLFDGTPENTFDSMPIPGAVGYLQVNFTTGTANAGFAGEIGNILNIGKGIQSFDSKSPLKFLTTDVDAAVSALTIVGNLFSLVPGTPSVTVDLTTSQGHEVALTQSSAWARNPGVLRLPAGRSIFFVIPRRDQATFQQILKDVATNGQFVQLDQQAGMPFISKDKAGMQPLDPLVAGDLNKQSALQACTIVVLAFSVASA